MSRELDALLRQRDVEDIVLSPSGLSCYRLGRWEGPHPSPLCESASLRRLAQGIAETASLQLGLTQPSVDTYVELVEGQLFRAHVAITPLVARGPEITLRRLPEAGRFRLEDFCRDAALLARLRDRIQGGASILVSGRTGSGKTSFLTACLAELPAHLRILVLEDSPELPIPNALSSKLLARPDRYGFRNGAAWGLAHLVFESLRMRPDRIVVGECRGAEAEGMAQALRTGHRGLLATIHAGSAAESFVRFAELAARPQATARGLGWDIGIQVGEIAPGRRGITEFLEVPA